MCVTQSVVCYFIEINALSHYLSPNYQVKSQGVLLVMRFPSPSGGLPAREGSQS